MINGVYIVSRAYAYKNSSKVIYFNSDKKEYYIN